MDKLLKASGYTYHNGTRLVASFIAKFGFNPAEYSNYFRVTATGYVVAKPTFYTACKSHFGKIADGYATLGVQTQ